MGLDPRGSRLIGLMFLWIVMMDLEDTEVGSDCAIHWWDCVWDSFGYSCNKDVLLPGSHNFGWLGLTMTKIWWYPQMFLEREREKEENGIVPIGKKAHKQPDLVTIAIDGLGSLNLEICKFSRSILVLVEHTKIRVQRSNWTPLNKFIVRHFHLVFNDVQVSQTNTKATIGAS